MQKDPDAHGQAALMLCETLMILLIERGVVPKALTLDAITDIIDVKQEIAGTTESVVVSLASIGMLRAIAQSLSAVTVRERPDPAAAA